MHHRLAIALDYKTLLGTHGTLLLSKLDIIKMVTISKGLALIMENWMMSISEDFALTLT